MPDLPLSVRQWNCSVYGIRHDRDLNAESTCFEEPCLGRKRRSHAEDECEPNLAMGRSR